MQLKVISYRRTRVFGDSSIDWRTSCTWHIYNCRLQGIVNIDCYSRVRSRTQSSYPSACTVLTFNEQRR